MTKMDVPVWTSIGIRKKEQTQNKETKSKHEKQHQYGTNASTNINVNIHIHIHIHRILPQTQGYLVEFQHLFGILPDPNTTTVGTGRYRSRDDTQSRERVLCGDKSESIIGNISRIARGLAGSFRAAAPKRGGSQTTYGPLPHEQTQHNDVAIVAIVKLMTMTNLGRYISKKPPHGSTLFLLFHNRLGIAMALCWKNH